MLHGQFPHSRFFSLTSYGTINGQRGTALGGLSDYQIKPDPGSTNPFRDGTSRTTRHRSFTVTLSGNVDPGVGHRAANTFYVGQTGQTTATQTIEMIMRIYRADENTDLAGGVSLPTATLRLADGTHATGGAACRALQTQSGFDKLSLTGISVPQASYLTLLSLPGAAKTHPAVDPISWNRFFNTRWLLEPFYAGTSLSGQISTLPTALIPGLYPTPANAYITSYADRSFGPNRHGHNILVLHAKLPTHPDTFAGDSRNDYAGKQVRYWSLCNYGAIANPPLIPANTDCLFDQEIPTNAHGYYTIVVSLPQDRPRNAIARCGVAWMNWTTKGDDVPGGHNRLISLTMRNQLASPSFAHGIDKIPTPGSERKVMGAYYPTGTYTTKRHFEKHGCAA